MKNQAKAKKHIETELLLFENYLFSPSRYHSKVIENILKNVQNSMCVCFNETISLIIIKINMKKRSHTRHK